MKDNFPACLTEVLKYEGPTRGITLDTYRIFMRDKKINREQLTYSDIQKIYNRCYWNICSCDELPKGIDLCVFDVAVNSGTDRAKKTLQHSLGVSADGVIGPKSLQATHMLDPNIIIERFYKCRISFYRSHKSFKTFGSGWLQRAKEIEAVAQKMAKFA